MCLLTRSSPGCVNLPSLADGNRCPSIRLWLPCCIHHRWWLRCRSDVRLFLALPREIVLIILSVPARPVLLQLTASPPSSVPSPSSLVLLLSELQSGFLLHVFLSIIWISYHSSLVSIAYYHTSESALSDRIQVCRYSLPLL
jgi:hypothetical protein